MDPTLDLLTGTQAAIESLFSRPLRRVPTTMDPTLRERFISTEAYRWGLKNLQGVGVSWPSPPEVQLYLAEKPIEGFREGLQGLLPGAPLGLLITGMFQFMAKVGDNISLDNEPELGTIALFVKDRNGTAYALTCAHVLDGNPTHTPQVDSGSARIGELTERVDVSYGCKTGNGANANLVDCALAQIDNGVSRSNALTGGSSITGFASARQPQNVTIITRSTAIRGTVNNTNSDCCIFDANKHQFAYFQNLLSITGSADIGGGDSGSVLLSNENEAVGMVIAASSSGMVLACDMVSIITALENLMPHAGSSPSLSLL
jgi:hypothetical protein